MTSTHTKSLVTSRFRTTGLLFVSLLLSLNLVACLEEYDNTPKPSHDTNNKEKDVLDIADDVDDIDTSDEVDHTCIPGCEDQQYCFEGTCYTPPMLALGSRHSCALSNETIQCWGANNSGQLGTDDRDEHPVHTTPQPVDFNDTPIGVYASGLQTCAITVDKDEDNSQKIYCWGAHSALEHVSGSDVKFAPAPENIDDVREGIPSRILPEQIAIGTSHVCVRFEAASGLIRCWGNNHYGQLGNGNEKKSLKPVEPSNLLASQHIGAGDSFTCSLNRNQTVSCWGANDRGQLGQALAGAEAANTPQFIPNLEGVVSIQVGNHHACALLKEKTLKCWGDNRHGQLGDGSLENSFTPLSPRPALENVKQIVGGNTFTCALLESGEVYCAGANESGQLGRAAGANDRSKNFIKYPHLSNVHQLAAGSNHLCAVHDTNKVSCWGLNEDHQIGADTHERIHIPVPLTL